jgi:hypothetical protein
VNAQDDFATLYQRYRVEEQLLWYRARARGAAVGKRVLLAISVSMLVLIAVVNALAAAQLVSRGLWVAFGIIVPVTALLLVALLGYSAPGRRSRLYPDVVRALEAARAYGERLRLAGMVEAEIGVEGVEVGQWVEGVENILRTAREQDGQMSAMPGWDARPTTAEDR